ncbi:MAG: hypothetical protein QM817_40400 [Archangium sp.]
MRLCLAIVVISAASAWADVLPDDVAVCHSKKAGEKCVTDDGEEGVCVERLVSRPDYRSGIPPKYTQVKMLGCVANAKGTARSMVPWFGFGLGFFALLLALRFRGPPRSGSPIST